MLGGVRKEQGEGLVVLDGVVNLLMGSERQKTTLGELLL